MYKGLFHELNAGVETKCDGDGGLLPVVLESSRPSHEMSTSGVNDVH